VEEKQAIQRILVADDDDVSRLMVQFQLTRAGYDVVAVENGQEAIDHLQSSAFDILITDEQMPVVSGRELCKLIRSDVRLVEVPIIMVTSKCLEIDVAMLRENLGVVDVLPKPFSPRELLKSVQNCIQSRQPVASADEPESFSSALGRGPVHRST
jgi:CheY-like chemotaxis protein